MVYMVNKCSYIRAFNEVKFNAGIGSLIVLNSNDRISVSVYGEEKLRNNLYDVCHNPAFIYFENYKIQPYALDKSGLDYLEALGLITKIS